MIQSHGVFRDANGFLEGRLGPGEVFAQAKEVSEVVQIYRHLRMSRAESLPADGKGLAGQRLSFVVATLLATEVGQIAECHRKLGVLLTERRFPDLNHLLQQAV